MKMKFFCFLILIIFSGLALSHEGPPYPVLVDHKFNQSKLSVWTDPDTEKGLFLLYVDGQKKTDLIVELEATSNNEILNTKVFSGVENGGKITYTATLPFPYAGLWNVKITLQDKQNASLLTSVTLPIEVTPPGPNIMESLVYMLPFVLVGFIWLRVILYKRKKSSHS